MTIRGLWTSVALCVVAVTGCGAPHVEGSGQVAQSERQVQEFETIGVNDGIALTVVVDPNQPQQVRVVGDDNLVKLVRTAPSGTHGIFAYVDPDEAASWSSANPLRLEVTVPKLIAISQSGGGDIDVSGSLVNPEFFTLSAMGGTVKVRGLDTESFNLSVMAGGEVTVEGRATQVTGTFSGGGKLQARELTTRVATLSSSGGGSMELRVSDALSVRATSGTVHIVGKPVVTRKDLDSGAVLTFEQP